MTTIRELFQPFIDKLKTQQGWYLNKAEDFVEDVINNYIVDQVTGSVKSQLLYDQLTNLANARWFIELPVDDDDKMTGSIETRQDIQRIFLPVLNLGISEYSPQYSISSGSAVPKNFTDNAAIFVGNLAHELGHAQDYQLNAIKYVDDASTENGLSIGAQLALDFLSEGKALYNNIKVAKQIQDYYQFTLHYPEGAFDVPIRSDVDAINGEVQNFITDPRAAILIGANSYFDNITSGTNTRYIEYYWEGIKTRFLNHPPAFANQTVQSILTNLKMNNANGLELSQNPNQTITMRVTFNGNNLVSSYINTFGNYEEITASGWSSGGLIQQSKSPSPEIVRTYQQFNFADGSYLLDEYNAGAGVNPLQPAETYNEAIRYFISSGAVDVLQYGQYNRIDGNNHVISVDLVGDGAVATVSNVAAVTLEQNAVATVYGTNNTITLNGNNTLKIGVDATHPFGNTYDVIKNFNTSDHIELVGVTGIIGAPVLDSNNILTVHTKNGNIAQDVSVQFSASPYVQYMDFSKDFTSGTAKISAAMKAGFHIVQANETAASIAASVGLSADVLTKINSVFDDADFSVGGVVRVPLSTGNANNLAPLPTGRTYVYNPNSNVAFVVPSRLDGHDNGALIIDPSVASPLFKKGTYSSVSKNFGNGDITVGLTTANGVAVGSIVLNLTSNAGTFYLSSGYSIPVSNISALNLTAPAAASSPVDAVVNYLSQFGTQVSQQQLSDLNEAFLNPTGSGYTVTGVVTNTSTPTTDSANDNFFSIKKAA